MLLFGTIGFSHDLASLQTLIDAIEEKKDAHEDELLAKKEAKDASSHTLTRRLGKRKFQEKPVDFLYSDELPSSFRSLKVSLPTGIG